MGYWVIKSLTDIPEFIQLLYVLVQLNFAVISGQTYKASTLINYDSIVVSISNLLVITSIES